MSIHDHAPLLALVNLFRYWYRRGLFGPSPASVICKHSHLYHYAFTSITSFVHDNDPHAIFAHIVIVLYNTHICRIITPSLEFSCSLWCVRRTAKIELYVTLFLDAGSQPPTKSPTKSLRALTAATWLVPVCSVFCLPRHERVSRLSPGAATLGPCSSDSDTRHRRVSISTSSTYRIPPPTTYRSLLASHGRLPCFNNHVSSQPNLSCLPHNTP